MANKKVVYCKRCARNTRQIYICRERNGVLKEIVFGVLTLGLNPLLKLVKGKPLGGLSCWECTKCGRINEG